MGNWMFAYAAALSKGADVVFCNTGIPLEDESLIKKYGEMFPSVRLVHELPPGVVTYREPHFHFSPIPDVTSAGLHIWGVFQSEKYFDCEKVRQAFAISPGRERRLREKYGEILKRPNITAIHVRRGDYLKFPHVHPFVGKGYFKSALSRLPECKDFVVCSDDLVWCRRFFPRHFPGRRFFFADDSFLDSLYLMSLCQNNVISNSSFSWWGAWLNRHAGKRVLAPSRWFGVLGPQDWQDIYFQGVEIVPVRPWIAQSLNARCHVIRELLGQRVRKLMKLT